ncbi:MAG: NAD+ synthase [Actinomycetota bacterium]
MQSIRVALAQLNPTVGDLERNLEISRRAIDEARQAGADLVALPELIVTGYPPEDLLLKPSFIRDNLEALAAIASSTSGVHALVGFVEQAPEGIYNAAALISDGEVRGIYRKHRLPNYGVFDEERYFHSGEGILLAHIGESLVGFTICEDLWDESGPHAACASAGAQLVININGSPFHRDKGRERLNLIRSRAERHGIALAYVNMVGGQDELVFDGQSMAITAEGELLVRAAQFVEELAIFDFEPSLAPTSTSHNGGEEAVKIVRLEPARDKASSSPIREAPEMDPVEEVYAALVLGVRDYLRKNRFAEALVGLSGGIDSSLTAAIAADALGPGRVTGVLMPSDYTSTDSSRFAQELAANLGIRTEVLPIADSFETLLKTLDPVFSGTEPGIAEENLQSRIRGMLLMAISNKRPDCIVLSTGNKSEMATGYATLYGDMAGGFAVLKDVSKTLVYELAGWRNQQKVVIPQGVIERAPSAELRPDQKDTDSLPAYDILDPILEAYVEDDRSPEEIIDDGHDPDIVKRVAEMVDRSEYKRRQAPPGIKITERAFGRDRRLPITNRYQPFE